MVRFADGPTTEVTRQVAAPPEAVWPLVIDIGLPVGGSPELQQTEWLDGATGPAVGARFRGHNRRGDVAWQTESTITEFGAPNRFTWVVGDPDDAVATWGFELAPGEDGTTTVRQWTRLGPGRSGLTWAIKQNPEAEDEIISGRLADLRRGMDANLAAIQQKFAG